LDELSSFLWLLVLWRNFSARDSIFLLFLGIACCGSTYGNNNSCLYGFLWETQGMNYLPFIGGWFYGAGLISGEQMAAYYSSWGLLAIAPELLPSKGGSIFMFPHTHMLM